MRRWRRYLEQWFAEQGTLRAARGPTGGEGPASGGSYNDPMDRGA